MDPKAKAKTGEPENLQRGTDVVLPVVAGSLKSAKNQTESQLPANETSSNLQTARDSVLELEAGEIKVAHAAQEHQATLEGVAPQVSRQFEATPAPVKAARGEYLLELFRNAEKPEAEQLRLAAEARARLGIGPEHGVYLSEGS